MASLRRAKADCFSGIVDSDGSKLIKCYVSATRLDACMSLYVYVQIVRDEMSKLIQKLWLVASALR